MQGNRATIKPWVLGILIMILIGAAYSVFANFMIRILGIPDVSLIGNDPVSLMEEDSLLLLILLEVLIAPVVEELLFRKILYGALRRRLHWAWAAIITSLIFAVFHLNIAQGVYALVFSLILCEIAERTANWYLCAAAHIAANAFSILASRNEAVNALLLSKSAATVLVSAGALIAGMVLLVLYEARGHAVFKRA